MSVLQLLTKSAFERSSWLKELVFALLASAIFRLQTLGFLALKPHFARYIPHAWRGARVISRD